VANGAVSKSNKENSNASKDWISRINNKCELCSQLEIFLNFTFEFSALKSGKHVVNFKQRVFSDTEENEILIPYLVSLSTRNTICCGALVSDRVVLTVASCTRL